MTTSRQAREVAERRDFLAGIITTAVEGGIGYWSLAQDYRWFFPTIDGGTAVPGENGTANAHVTLHPNVDEESDFEPVTITVEKIEEALGKIRREQVQLNGTLRRLIYRGDATNEGGDIDAGAADAIVQIAAFGEVVYG